MMFVLFIKKDQKLNWKDAFEHFMSRSLFSIHHPISASSPLPLDPQPQLT